MSTNRLYFSLLHCFIGFVLSAQVSNASYEEAVALFNQAQYVEAARLFENFIKDNPQEPRLADAEYHHAFCQYLRGEYDAFLSSASAFRAKYPASGYIENLALHQAFVSYHRNEWASARIELLDFSSRYPLSSQAPQAELYAALCLYSMKNYQPFIEAAQAWKEKYPNQKNETLAWQAGMAAYLQSDWTSAHQQLKAFMQDFPDSTLAHEAAFNAAVALNEAGESDAFLKEVEQFAQFWPLSPHCEELNFRKAMTAWNEGDWAKARDAFQEFVAAHPQSRRAEDAEFQETMCLFNKHAYSDFEKEAIDYRIKYPKGAHDESLAYHLAMAPYLSGEWLEAHARLRAFSADFPESKLGVGAAFYAAFALYHGRDFAGFVRESNDFQMLYPNPGSNYLTTFELHESMIPYLQGDWNAAKESLEGFLNQNPAGDEYLSALMIYSHSLIAQARNMDSSGKVTDANQLRAAGQAYMSDLRKHIDQMLEQLPADQSDRRIALKILRLESWFEEEAYRELAEESERFGKEFQENHDAVAVGKLWSGIARLYLTPPDLDGAIQAFDSVIEANLSSKDYIGELKSRAAYWRAAIAQGGGDMIKVNECITRIRNEEREGNVKTLALGQFAWVDGTTTNTVGDSN